jgi:hypothetical protein
VLLNHHLTFFLPPLEFSVPPLHVVTLAVLIWAFHKGSAFGVRLAVLVWVISLIVGIYFQFILTEITGAIRISFSIRTPAQAVGLAILAWWAGQIGLVYKDKQRLEKISQLYAPLRRHQPLSVDPGYGVLFVAFLFFIQLHIAIKTAESGHAAISFSFNALVLVIALVSIWSLRHNGQAISNRILPLMLLFATFHYQYVIGGIRLASSYIDLLDIMSLCLIPIITSYLEIKTRAHWRILIFGTLIALILPDIYVRGGYVPFFAILELSFVKTNLVLLTWALTLAGFELVTRICTLAASAGDDQPET